MSTILDPRRREEARLAELNRLGAMRQEADRVLQELVDDAREVFGTQYCMVNLVTSDEQYFKAWSGEPPSALDGVRRNPRERSMCRHVVEDERPFVVEDFSTAEQFKEQHLRMGPGVRFYAGTPLKTSGGHAIGSFCVLDGRPREFGDRDMVMLRTFARAAVGRLEALGAAAQERGAKESERHYRRNVFELANDAILIYGTQTGLILDANRRACEMYGIPQESLVGKRAAELSLEPEGEAEHSRELLHLGTYRGFETVHRRADGAPMHVSVNSSVTEYGGQRAILSIVRDVTGRRRAEEALQLNEKSLAQAQRIAHTGNWEHELETHRTRWSDEMYRIFGFAPGALLPSYKTFMIFVHPDDKGRVRRSIRGALYHDGPEDIEYRIVRPDGEVRCVHTQYEVAYDEAGRPIEFFGTVQDVTERKHVEQKLMEAEEKYRLLVEQIPAVAYIDRADVADAAFYTSPRIEALLGYTPEEWLTGRLWLERLHPDDRDRVLEADTRARAAEEPFGEEYRLIARDGRVVWVRDESALLRDEAGRPLLWQGILLDITERKLAEEALHRSEERFRSLIQSAPDVIMVLDADTNILYESPSIERVLGYEPGERVGSKGFDYVHPEDIGKAERTFAEVLNNPGTEAPIEYRLRHKDGSWRHFEATRTNLLDDPAVGGIVINCRDITERKRAEEALRESEAWFRAIFENAALGISIADLDRRLLETNVAYQDMLGYGREELAGKPIAEFSHPEDVPMDTELNKELLAGNIDRYQREKRYIRKDGELVWVRPTISVIRDAEDEPRFLVGMVEDVTERKLMEEALRESEESYRRQARELELLHRVRTALAQGVELQTVFRMVVEAIARTYGYTQVSGYLLRGETLVLQHQVGYEQVLERIPVTRGVMGRAIRTRRPILVGDVHSEPAFLGAIEGVTSEVCVPLFDEGEVVGALNVESTGSVELAEEDLRLMSALAEHVNVAISRSRLYARVRESEERFRSLIQNASDVVTLLEVDGTIRYQSPSIERMLGYRPEELVGRNAFDYIHPDDLDRALGTFSEMLADPGLRPSVEYRFRHKDGSWCYLESVGSNQLDDPRIGELVVNSRDITERKRWEEKLRGAEERYRSLVETIPAMTYVDELDEISTCTYISPQIESILGYTAGERMDTPDLWMKSLHPEDRERVLAANDRSNATGDPFNEEYRMVARDGREVWLHDASVVLRDAGGRPSYRQGVMFDVTERRRTEEALHASEMRLRTVIEQSPLGIHIFAPDGTSLLANDAWDELWCLEDGESPDGTNVFEDEQLRAAGLLGYVEQSIDGDAVETPSMLFDPASAGRGGDPRWLKALIYPVRDGDGRLKEVALLLEDVTERMEAETALGEAEERYRTLVEQVPAVVYVDSADDTNAAVFRSSHVEEVLGYAPEEFTSDPELWQKILHPEDRERVLAENELTNRTGEPFKTEYRMTRNDGRTVWLRDEAVLVRDEEGAPAYWHGVFMDITERKRAEERTRFQAQLLEQVQAAVISTDTEGTVVHWNKHAERLYGWSREEAVGRKARELMVSPLEAGVAEEILKKLRAGETWEGEFTVRRKDGSTLSVYVTDSPVHDMEGRVIGFVGVSTDTTERKRAEDALKESEERYRAVVEQSAEAIWLFDPDTKRVLEANAAFQEMLGYGAEELRSMTNYDFAAHSPEDVDRTVDRKLQEEEILREERKYRMKDGTLLDVEVGGTAISYRGKRVVCSVARDVTERKRVEEEMRETNRRLSELATLRADFTAMVAHELDTPLAVIRGFADVLALGELGAAERERALTRIQAETEVLNALVEDVRVAASAERRDFTINPRKVPTDELIDDAARFAATLPGKHPLVLEGAADGVPEGGVRAGYADPFVFGGAADRQEVWADRYRIGQVLRNLLTNAVKYSPEGSPIQLRAVPGGPPGRVRIEVVDRGPGIHPDDHERIFEKFGRGRDPQGRKVAGLGLGLYLSRRILQAHGSDLTVDAAPEGGGSTFGFDLEAADE